MVNPDSVLSAPGSYPSRLTVGHNLANRHQATFPIQSTAISLLKGFTDTCFIFLPFRLHIHSIMKKSQFLLLASLGLSALTSQAQVQSASSSTGQPAPRPVAPAACAVSVPINLTASNVIDVAATFLWRTVPGTYYDVRYRKTGSTTWETGEIYLPQNSVRMSVFLPGTTYEAQVRSKCIDANGNDSAVSAYSPSVVFTTAKSPTYCPSYGQGTQRVYLSRVQLGSLNNLSVASAGAYGNFTRFSTDLTQKSTYLVTISVAYPRGQVPTAYGVWIDYNRDNDFDDANEHVLTIGYFGGDEPIPPVSASFMVPAGALPGKTRMRVIANQVFTGNVFPCDHFMPGETEDYTINIVSGAKADEVAADAQPNLELYPNPVNTYLHMAIAGQAVQSFAIYTADGQPATHWRQDADVVDVSLLKRGLYFVVSQTPAGVVRKSFFKQ